MKKRLAKGIGAVLLAVMMLTLNGSLVFANFGTGTVKVPINQVMALAEEDVSRTTQYSFTTIGALSVYPTQLGVEDNFKKCKTQLYECNTSTPASKVYTLEENTIYTKVYLNEGQMNLTEFDLRFAGNSKNYPAYIDYYFNGN